MPSCKYMHMFVLLQWDHLHTYLNTYSNMLICENECKWTEMLTDWQEAHQSWLDWCWQMECSIFSGRIPLPFSNPKPCPRQKLDRHSTIKPNKECAFNEQGEGGEITPTSSNLLHMQARRHILRHTFWTSTRSAAKTLQAFNKNAHSGKKHTIRESTRGQRSLDRRASHLKNESLAILHAMDLLSDMISL